MCDAFNHNQGLNEEMDRTHTEHCKTSSRRVNSLEKMDN